MAAGLAQLVDDPMCLRFAEDELAWLAASGRLDAGFVGSLRAIVDEGGPADLERRPGRS